MHINLFADLLKYIFFSLFGQTKKKKKFTHTHIYIYKHIRIHEYTYICTHTYIQIYFSLCPFVIDEDRLIDLMIEDGIRECGDD